MSLDTAHCNRQNSLFAMEKLLHTRKNQQWEKSAETSRNMREEGRKKYGRPHRKSAEVYLFRAYTYDVTRVSFCAFCILKLVISRKYFHVKE